MREAETLLEDLLVVLLSRGLVSYLVVLQFDDFLQLEGLAALFLADKHGLVEEEGVPEGEQDHGPNGTGSGLLQTVLGRFLPKWVVMDTICKCTSVNTSSTLSR